MKISEVIVALATLQQERGDLEVMREDFRENTFFDVKTVLFCPESQNKETPACIVLGDNDDAGLLDLIGDPTWSRIN